MEQMLFMKNANPVIQTSKIFWLLILLGFVSSSTSGSSPSFFVRKFFTLSTRLRSRPLSDVSTSSSSASSSIWMPMCEMWLQH